MYEDTFINFFTFENVAKIETIGSITKDDKEKLLKEINNPDIWLISTMFHCTTFFVYTDEQKSKYQADSTTKDDWTRRYIEIIKRYDEFNSFNGEYELDIDSKENFDNNWGGNWYH